MIRRTYMYINVNMYMCLNTYMHTHRNKNVYETFMTSLMYILFVHIATIRNMV
jgi:hypothetical protein